jgi:hypothetical protein
MRFGVALQPAWARTASIVVETSSTFGERFQAAAEQTWRSARAAFEDQFAKMLIAFLTPAATVALVFGLWRFGVDLEWTAAFPINSGFFSHWQVWIALAGALQGLASAGSATLRKAKSPGDN